jgi:hypothetical protein
MLRVCQFTGWHSSVTVTRDTTGVGHSGFCLPHCGSSTVGRMAVQRLLRSELVFAQAGIAVLAGAVVFIGGIKWPQEGRGLETKK